MARTDDDTWDLASSVGATATLVAAQRALATRRQLIDDPYAEPLTRAVGADFPIRMLDGEIDLLGDSVGSGFTDGFAAEIMAVRTRHFDRLFVDAVAAGTRQAVILAAGLDARAYRLDWPDGTVLFEIDQPEVIEFKSRALVELGAATTADHRVVGIDLRKDWPQALLDNGFDPAVPTAWIAEGLLIYLPPEAQDALFDNITALSAPGSRLATEHAPDRSLFSDERSEATREQTKDAKADLIFDGKRNDVVAYLAEQGWQVSALPIREAHQMNGFDFPEGKSAVFFDGLDYVSATLTGPAQG
jgi:methyltransferase (TIGR00027 family)